MNTGNLFKSKENELYILVKNIDGKVGIFKNFINSENITSDISCFEKVGFNTSNEFVSWVKSHKKLFQILKQKYIILSKIKMKT